MDDISADDADCRRKPELFAAVEEKRPPADVVAAAVDVCHGCPALAACREWAARQPRNGLSGVVAGVHYSSAWKAA